MKKFLAIFLAVMLCLTAVVALAACEYEDEGIEIEFYSTMGQALQTVTATYIKEFNRIYPNIKIKHTVLSGNYADLNKRVDTELNSNKGPAVTYCYPDHVAGYMAKGNKVVCLDDYIYSTETVEVGKFGNTEAQKVGLTPEEIDDFFPAFFNEGKESYGDGTKMYSLPLAKSSEVMYYNKTFFDQNDLEIPTHWFSTDPNDTTSMEYVCEKILKDCDPNCVPFGYDSEDNFFITLAEQLQTLPENQGKILYTSSDANDHYKFDNPEMREIMSKLNDWFIKGYFLTQSTNGNSYMSTSFKGEDSSLKQCYMCIGSTGGATYQVPSSDKFEVGIAEIPQMNLENRKVISQGPNICILRNQNNQTKDQILATWLWVKFLTTDLRFQAQFSMASGYTPVIQSVQEDPNYKMLYLELPETLKGEDRIGAMAVKQCLAQADGYYTSPAFAGSAEARQQAGYLLTACLDLYDGASGTVEQQIQAAFTRALNACKLFGVQ